MHAAVAPAAGGGLAGVLILVFLAAAYFIPTIIVLARKKRDPGPTIVINIFLGWTFIGWVVALAMSFGATNTQANQQVVVMNGAQTPAGWYPDMINPGMSRWWNGQAWTADSRPAP
jgi:hypothetical protein